MKNLPENYVIFKSQGQKWLHTKLYNSRYIELSPWDVWGVEIGLRKNTFRMESAAFALYFFLFIALLFFMGEFPYQLLYHNDVLKWDMETQQVY